MPKFWLKWLPSESIVVQEIGSHIGLNIETYDALDSEFALLSFVDLNQRLVEIKGRIVYTKQKRPGKFESGIRLEGTSAEKLEFIKKLVRTYHYTKNDPRKFAHCSNSN